MIRMDGMYKPPPKRPEYVRCVGLGVGRFGGDDYGKSWCGRLIYEYSITPLDEALEHPERGGYLESEVETDPHSRRMGRVSGVRRLELYELAFPDATSALLGARRGERSTICPACAAAMRAALGADPKAP